MKHPYRSLAVCFTIMSGLPLTARAQERWYGDVRQIMVTPLRVTGAYAPEATQRAELWVAQALRQRLPGITVIARTEMQGRWGDMFERTRGCAEPACTAEMARNIGADTVVAAHLNLLDARGVLTLRWIDVERGAIVRTRDEFIGRDEQQHEAGVRRAVDNLVAQAQVPVSFNSAMEAPPTDVPPPAYTPPPAYAPPPAYTPPPAYAPPPAYVDVVPAQQYGYASTPCSTGAQCQSQGDFGRAVALYNGECQAGMAASCFAVGALAEQGQGAPVDEYRARQYYGQACQMNWAEACVNLAVMAESGRGGPLDYGQARNFYERSCGLGFAGGCYGVAVMWERGRGMPADPMQARTYYGRACSGGEGRGCAGLASLHEAGRGGPADRGEAMRMFEMGCNHGDAESCRRVGRPVPVVAPASSFAAQQRGGVASPTRPTPVMAPPQNGVPRGPQPTFNQHPTAPGQPGPHPAPAGQTTFNRTRERPTRP